MTRIGQLTQRLSSDLNREQKRPYSSSSCWPTLSPTDFRGEVNWFSSPRYDSDDTHHSVDFKGKSEKHETFAALEIRRVRASARWIALILIPINTLLFPLFVIWLRLIDSWNGTIAWSGMLLVDVSNRVVTAPKWQFVTTFSVGTCVRRTVIDRRTGGKTMDESMSGEVSRSGCLVLAFWADVRLHVRI